MHIAQYSLLDEGSIRAHGCFNNACLEALHFVWSLLDPLVKQCSFASCLRLGICAGKGSDPSVSMMLQVSFPVLGGPYAQAVPAAEQHGYAVLQLSIRACLHIDAAQRATAGMIAKALCQTARLDLRQPSPVQFLHVPSCIR